LGGLFTQILGLCARAGLVSVGVIALDGTAIAANASSAATRSHESIREEVERILGEAAEIDAREDEQFGETRGDELPADLRDRLRGLNGCAGAGRSSRPSRPKSRRPIKPTCTGVLIGRLSMAASSVAASRSRPIPTGSRKGRSTSPTGTPG
jgi:hypothetical protein